MTQIYVINLEKDKERINKVEKMLNAHGHNYTKVDGVYGKEMTQEEKHENCTSIFANYGINGAIGCAMSHKKTWELISQNDGVALILEDDVILSDDFNIELKKVLDNTPKDFDLLYLGYTLGSVTDNNVTELFAFFKGLRHKGGIVNEYVHIPIYPFACHSYVLSNKGAKKLLNILERDRIYTHIDMQINDCRDELNVYGSNKKIVIQNMKNSNNVKEYPKLLNEVIDKAVCIDDQMSTSYFVNSSVYRVYDIYISVLNVTMFIIFFILGFAKVDAKQISIYYFIYNCFEMFLGCDVSVSFVIKIYIFLMTGYYLGKTVSK